VTENVFLKIFEDITTNSNLRKLPASKKKKLIWDPTKVVGDYNFSFTRNLIMTSAGINVIFTLKCLYFYRFWTKADMDTERITGILLTYASEFFSLAGALLHIWPYITHVHWQSATSQPPLINPALFDARAPAAQGRTARAPTIAIESKKQTTDNRIPCSSAPHGGRISRTTRLLSTSELHYFGTRGRAEILPGVKVGGNAARRENIIICRRTQKNHENV
jgi:hypothetical protein